VSGMYDARFEFRLSGPQRRELDALASETGLSPSALARFGIHMVLQNREALLQPRTPPVVEPWQTPIKRCGPQSEASRGSRIMATHSGGRRDRDPEASSYTEGRLGGL